jgi:hypothetical protein
MYSFLILGLALVNLALLGWTLGCWWRHGHPVLLVLASLVMVLCFDGAVVGTGRWLGEGALLEVLNGARFKLLGLSMPVLLVIALATARLGALRWAQGTWLVPAAVMLGVAFVLLDWQDIFRGPALHPACWQDVLRHLPSVPADQACRPGQAGVELAVRLPRATFVALPLLVLTGIHLWWKRRWPWMFWGGVAFFVLPGLAAAGAGPLPGFLGDTLGLAALVATAAHFIRHPPPRRVGRYATM